MTIADSMIGGNAQDGIIATTPGGGALIGVYVKNTKSVNNAIGIRSIGPNVTVRVDGSSVIGNGTGLSVSGGARCSQPETTWFRLTARTARSPGRWRCSDPISTEAPAENPRRAQAWRVQNVVGSFSWL